MKIKIQFLKQVRQIYARKLGTQKSPDLNGLGSFIKDLINLNHYDLVLNRESTYGRTVIITNHNRIRTC